MEILVTGGTGFVGRALCRRLLNEGYSVTVLTRTAEAAQKLPRGVNLLLGDPTQPGPWQDEAARHGGAVNLAGASIFGKWSEQYKKLIRDSRVTATANLAEAMGRRPAGAQAVLISASAVGVYGFSDDRPLDEWATPGDDFLAQVCREWEAQARKAEAGGARVVLARFGIVLGAGGGAISQMLPIFSKGLGGPLGSGKQYFSWIHRDDLVSALLFCLQSQDLHGPVNLTSPQPVTNREFTKALGKALGRPAFLPAPGPAVRLALGEFGSVLLEGQRVIPRVLQEAGFAFEHPQLEEALRDLLVEHA